MRCMHREHCLWSVSTIKIDASPLTEELRDRDVISPASFREYDHDDLHIQDIFVFFYASLASIYIRRIGHAFCGDAPSVLAGISAFPRVAAAAGIFPGDSCPAPATPISLPCAMKLYKVMLCKVPVRSLGYGIYYKTVQYCRVPV